MSIWKVQIHMITIWCGTSRHHTPKIGKIFKDLSNVFGIADKILIVGYDADGRDHNRSLR